MGQFLSLQVAVSAAAILAICWNAIGTIVRRHFTRKMTVLEDLPKLGTPRQERSRILGTAVIIGGSIAGLWTARVCADHFEEVLIIEPELWTADREGLQSRYDENGNLKQDLHNFSRQRIPQYNAAHLYQPIQLWALRRLLPDFEAEVRKSDGRILPNEYNIHISGAHVLRLPVNEFKNKRDLDGFALSRDNYERILRGLVRKSSGRIRWLTGTATGFKAAASDTSILESVQVRTHDGTEKDVPASLVIDCSGSSQVGFKWLKRLYLTENPSPRCSQAFDNIKLEYKTMQRYQLYKIFVPPAIRPLLPIPGGYNKAGFIRACIPQPGVERCGFAVNRLEGHRIEFMFSGWSNPPIPATVHDIKDYFMNFEGEEPVPTWLLEIVDMLLEAKGAVETDTKMMPECSWIQFQRAPYVPSNFIAIGDSIMRANPTFGQGCSKAAMGAITLDGMLRSPRHRNEIEIPKNFGYNFFKIHNDRIASAWDGTKPMDYQWDSTVPVKGEELSDADLMAGFSNIVMEIAKTDDKVDSALWRVRCFLAPPTDLIHPSILAKVALFWVRRQLGFA